MEPRAGAKENAQQDGTPRTPSRQGASHGLERREFAVTGELCMCHRFRFPNFADLLDADPDDPAFTALRRNELIGRPLGDRAFQDAISRSLGRAVTLGKRGASRNASAAAGDAGGRRFRKRELRACHRNRAFNPSSVAQKPLE